MIKRDVMQAIDGAIKEIWLDEICRDYGSGKLLREASLQSSLYHHIRSYLEGVLEENNLFIYPEFYIPGLKYRTDLAVVEVDRFSEGYLSSRVSNIAALIELKFVSGTAQDTMDVVKADLQKLKQYLGQIDGDLQLYFGIIYETECKWLSWLDRRSTNHWANGCVTELNAGYLDGVMTFEVNSYNHMNIQNKSAICQMLW